MACLGLAALPAFADTIVVIPGTSDIYLAGMPIGSRASARDPGETGADIAPLHSPVLVPGLSLSPGSALSFNAFGAVSNGPCCQFAGPDGDFSNIGPHFAGAENGMSDIIAPKNALVGVFLASVQPNLSGILASSLDFSTQASRDYLTLKPALQQVFFIGDGWTSPGSTGPGAIQQVIVPMAADRLYLGTMDGWEWNNNKGKFGVEVHTQAPEPGSLMLLATGLAAMAFTAYRRRLRR